MNTLVPVVPPLAPHSLLIFLLDLVVLLVLARLLGALAQRFGMPAITGELVTGILLGPSLLGVLSPGFSGWLLPRQPEQIHLLDAVGQVGVLLLVGVTGTHLDLGMIRQRKQVALSVSFGGLLVPLILGVTLGLVLPRSRLAGPGGTGWIFAAFLGVAMCLSAIPVIAKTLTDMRLLHRSVGQLTLAAGLVDDAVGWFLLSLVSAAATVGLGAAQFSRSLLYLCGFVLLAVLLGRPLVRQALRLASTSNEPGAVTAVTVIVVLVGGTITQSLGMEAVFGAFVAGMLVSAAGVDQVKLAGLRTVVLSVLAPIFLATAGLRVDLRSLANTQVALTGLAVLAIAVLGKFGGAYLGARVSRLSRWEGLAIGAGMNARGVVEVIVALTGLRLGVLTVASYTIVVLVAVVTSLMAPPMLRWTVGRIEQSEDERLRQLDHEAWNGLSVDSLPANGITAASRSAQLPYYEAPG